MLFPILENALSLDRFFWIFFAPELDSTAKILNVNYVNIMIYR